MLLIGEPRPRMLLRPPWLAAIVAFALFVIIFGIDLGTCLAAITAIAEGDTSAR